LEGKETTAKFTLFQMKSKEKVEGKIEVKVEAEVEVKAKVKVNGE
jgi:hypothetical protein